MTRLVEVEQLSVQQKKLLDKMLNGEGACCCGGTLTQLSAKFILCTAVSEHPTDKRQKGGLIMAAYCYDCFMRINHLLKALKNWRVHVTQA